MGAGCWETSCDNVLLCPWAPHPLCNLCASLGNPSTWDMRRLQVSPAHNGVRCSAFVLSWLSISNKSIPSWEEELLPCSAPGIPMSLLTQEHFDTPAETIPLPRERKLKTLFYFPPLSMDCVCTASVFPTEAHTDRRKCSKIPCSMGRVANKCPERCI